MKAIQPNGDARFRDARSMCEALAAVPRMYEPPKPAETHEGECPGLDLKPWELGRPDYNPYVTRLQTLHSQAAKNNRGTRGLDEIARFTYVNTRLDQHLAPDTGSSASNFARVFAIEVVSSASLAVYSSGRIVDLADSV